ncbi:MAG: selenoneine biosynthesis selenosugar synthase SenB [Burkholderiaceae bacterium]
MTRARIALVTPALASANNGNWQTASRWARFLSADYRVSLLARWQGEPADLLVALHARRSAPSIAAWAAAAPRRPLIVVLTGTDLYRDIDSDADAQASLRLADRLVVLNALGARRLPEALRDKVRVCLQSATARQTLAKSARCLRVLMVGHLRAEKDPQTYLAAAEALAARRDIAFDHIGEALDPALGEQARAWAARWPRYRWLGAMPHEATRRRIQRAHVLVQASRMEGGAHTVIEALRSGTPVLASRIDGNLGLLGDDYAGVFEPGDAAGLAALVARCRDDPAMLAQLQQQCAARAPLFQPQRERATLLAIVAELLETR